MKQFILGLLLVSSLVAVAFAEDRASGFQPDAIFGEKVVLCAIEFQPDSYTLSDKAKRILDKVVDQLKQVDPEKKVIRIEGYIGERDTAAELTRLSMRRALAVEDYIRVNHAVTFERFLTGHNSSGADCRAEIAVYDNPWQADSDPVQVTKRIKIDGPS